MSSPALTQEELNYYASLDLADPDDDTLQQFLQRGQLVNAPFSEGTSTAAELPDRNAAGLSTSSSSASAAEALRSSNTEAAHQRPSSNAFRTRTTALSRRPGSASFSAGVTRDRSKEDGLQSDKISSSSSNIDKRCGVTDVLDKTDLVGGIAGIADAALQTRVVELPNRHLTSVQAIQCFLNATHLYLQHNQLRTLDGLELLQQLQVLVVHHNALTDVAALRGLDRLFYLDLSFNALASLPTLLQHALPCAGLQYLNLNGNPCVLVGSGPNGSNGLPEKANDPQHNLGKTAVKEESDDCVAAVRAACPALTYFNETRLTRDADEEGSSSSSSSTNSSTPSDAPANNGAEEKFGKEALQHSGGEAAPATAPAALSATGRGNSSRRMHELVEAARVAARTGPVNSAGTQGVLISADFRSFDGSARDGDSGEVDASPSRAVASVRSMRTSKHATALEEEEERLVHQLLKLRSVNRTETAGSIFAAATTTGVAREEKRSNGVEDTIRASVYGEAAMRDESLDTTPSANDALQLFQGLQYTQEVNQARQQRDVAAHWDDVSRVLQTAQALQQDRRRRMHERLRSDTPSYAETLALLQKESYTDNLDRYRHAEKEQQRPAVAAAAGRQPSPLQPQPQSRPSSSSPSDDSPIGAVPIAAVSQKPSSAPSAKPASQIGPKAGSVKPKRSSLPAKTVAETRHLPKPPPKGKKN